VPAGLAMAGAPGTGPGEGEGAGEGVLWGAVVLLGVEEGGGGPSAGGVEEVELAPGEGAGGGTCCPSRGAELLEGPLPGGYWPGGPPCGG